MSFFFHLFNLNYPTQCKRKIENKMSVSMFYGTGTGETRDLLDSNHHIIYFHCSRIGTAFLTFTVGELRSLSSSLVRCLIAINPSCSVSLIAGKYVKPSKTLWFTGFNNPGNTNPISEQAEVGLLGWEHRVEEYATQRLTQCTWTYSNLCIVFVLTLDVNGRGIINQG